MSARRAEFAVGDFVGAKVALLCGARILVYLRDDHVGLPWAGRWDLPPKFDSKTDKRLI